MAIQQILPSALIEDASQEFEELLASRTASLPLADSYFEANWDPLWNELASLGWTTLADGNEFSELDLSFVAELWGRFLLPLPFVPTLAARRQSSDQAFDAGTRLSFALGSGNTTLVPYGNDATLVIAATNAVTFAFLGQATETDAFASSHPIAILAGNAGPKQQRLLAILLAAEAVGAADEVLRRTVDYVKQRIQFQRPVGSFQAVKHNLANTHVRVELARSGIACLCASETLNVRLITEAFDHCLRITENCVQAHGGIGFTWEAQPHRYYRHVMALYRSARAASHAPG